MALNLKKLQLALSAQVQKSLQERTGFRGTESDVDFLVLRWGQKFEELVYDSIWPMVGISVDSWGKMQLGYESPIKRKLQILATARAESILEEISPALEAAWQKYRVRATKVLTKAFEERVEKEIIRLAERHGDALIAAEMQKIVLEASQAWYARALPALDAELVAEGFTLPGDSNDEP